MTDQPQMPYLYHDLDFLRHDTGSHPECALRLERVYQHLTESGLIQNFECKPCPIANLDTILRVHSKGHVDKIQAFAMTGGGRVESDTMMCPASYDIALKAVGTACDAVTQVIQGTHKTATCLIRPPGHHAIPNGPMGFCLFNNIAVAAKFALNQFNLNRILIVDWDVHHGNGTQDVFWEDPQVGFLSIHRFPFYPGSGDQDETGSGAGLGTTVNLPMKFGVSRADFLNTFTTELERFAAKIKPDLVLLSAGFDGHRRDPIGSIGLEVEDFETLTTSVLQIANHYCSGRMVSLLEGGYNIEVLPLCVAEHLNCLLS